MTMSAVRRFYRDACFYRQLRNADKPGGGSLLATLLLSRGLWLLAFQRVAFYSVSQRNLRNPFWWLARLTESIGRYLAAVLCKSEIREDCDFEGDVYLSDKGYMICGAHKVGTGTLIHDHVTFGHAVANGKEGRPTIGANVWIGPNTIVAGPLTIGDGATVLPDSYLTNSVPPRAVVKGNPARVVRGNFNNATLRGSLAVVYEIVLPTPNEVSQAPPQRHE